MMCTCLEQKTVFHLLSRGDLAEVVSGFNTSPVAIVSGHAFRPKTSLHQFSVDKAAAIPV